MTEQAQETLRILLVEDNPDDAELLTVALADAGMSASVHRVEDDAGLEAALRDEWDLVVSDFALPTLGGLEVVRRVRELPDPPPVIVVSGTVGEELAVESIREGAVDYLLKDRLVRFPAAVRRAVETHRLDAQSRRLRRDLETQRSLSEAVMSSLNAQIAVLDHAGNIIAANNAWRDYVRDHPELGTPAEPVGENYLDHCRGGRSLVPEDLSGDAADGMRGVLERRLPSYQLDYPCSERDEPAWYSVTVLPLSGHRSGAVVSHQSITERILADSDRRLISRAVHVMSEALMILDLDLRILSVNQAFGNITGFAVDEVEGRLPPQWPRDHAGEALVDQIVEQLKRQNFWQGELICQRADGSTYREQCRIAPVRDESGDIRSFVGVFEDVTDLNEYARRLEHLARYDDDTGLVNRRYFLEELDRMIGTDDGVACLQMRLLKGRLIGDSFGHEIEQNFLKVAAGRVQASLRAGEICGRAGDNEFVVAMPCADASEAMQRAEAIQKLFDETILLGHQRLYSDVSVGISHTSDRETSAETLMRQSDVAMNSARHQSGSRPCLFQPAMGDHLSANLELAGELLNASERHEFSLAYQPRFTLVDGRVANLEALLRWNHPRMGPISPEVFVPVAEETGLILEIGRWVIQTALSQLGGWRAQGLDVPGVAINLSALQCRESDLPEWIVARVAEAGLTPADVELEITESTVLDIHGEVNRNLIALREAGFGLAIDDFGTGFSSLAYLKHLKAHTLKVDRSFVTELPEATQDREIVRAIAAVAQSLDMCLVAEGVETEAQEAFLREVGCDQVQGFRYARPMDAAAIEENFEGHHQLLVAAG